MLDGKSILPSTASKITDGSAPRPDSGVDPGTSRCSDSLVGPLPLDQLPAGSVVGTGSLRRQIQVKALRPDVEFSAIRGNVPTRIEKWRKGDYPGESFWPRPAWCASGPWPERQRKKFTPSIPTLCIPAPCQGILGLECREGDQPTLELLQLMHDPVAHWECLAERAFLAALGGGCNLPAVAYARAEGRELLMTAILQPEGSEDRRLSLQGPVDSVAHLGKEIAERLLQGLFAELNLRQLLPEEDRVVLEADWDCLMALALCRTEKISGPR